ncbi:uncharacterized protein RBU33_025631 isoform 2-T5 [Hipposideros larvatus]
MKPLGYKIGSWERGILTEFPGASFIALRDAGGYGVGVFRSYREMKTTVSDSIQKITNYIPIQIFRYCPSEKRGQVWVHCPLLLLERWEERAPVHGMVGCLPDLSSLRLFGSFLLMSLFLIPVGQHNLFKGIDEDILIKFSVIAKPGNKMKFRRKKV